MTKMFALMLALAIATTAFLGPKPAPAQSLSVEKQQIVEQQKKKKKKQAYCPFGRGAC